MNQLLPTSDREITKLLLETLEKKLIPDYHSFKAGLFLTEVTHPASGNRADVIFVGMTSSSGKRMDGYEIKASRADWLREMRKGNKADSWSDECQSWTLVTAPGVIKDGELPSNFGHWELRTTDKTTRLVQKQEPTIYSTRVPSWDAFRALLGRQESISDKKLFMREQSLNVEYTKILHELQKQVNKDNRVEQKEKTAQNNLKVLESRLGLKLLFNDYAATDDSINVKELDDAFKNYLRANRNVYRASETLKNRYSGENIARLKESIRDFEIALSALKNDL